MAESIGGNMNDKYSIYLDDVRTPVNKDWILVRSYEEFITKVEELGLDNIDIISLDHDLGDSAMEEYHKNVSPNFCLNYDNIKEKTGYDAAKWLVEKAMELEIPLPSIYTHSANPIGSANIMGYINNYLMNCRLPQTCVRVRIDIERL